MKNEKKCKTESHEIPKEDPEIDLILENLVQLYLEFIEENGVNQQSIRMLLKRIVVEASEAFFVAKNEVVAADGFTVIYDELEVGVGRRVYYLRTQAKDEASALNDFRQQFFSGRKPGFWDWLQPAVTVHVGVFLPEYVRGFPSLPKALMLQWPDTPY
jgi:hypothetical protein